MSIERSFLRTNRSEVSNLLSNARFLCFFSSRKTIKSLVTINQRAYHWIIMACVDENEVRWKWLVWFLIVRKVKLQNCRKHCIRGAVISQIFPHNNSILGKKTKTGFLLNLCFHVARENLGSIEKTCVEIHGFEINKPRIKWAFFVCCGKILNETSWIVDQRSKSFQFCSEENGLFWKSRLYESLTKNG